MCLVLPWDDGLREPEVAAEVNDFLTNRVHK